MRFCVVILSILSHWKIGLDNLDRWNWQIFLLYGHWRAHQWFKFMCKINWIGLNVKTTFLSTVDGFGAIVRIRGSFVVTGKFWATEYWLPCPGCVAVCGTFTILETWKRCTSLFMKTFSFEIKSNAFYHMWCARGTMAAAWAVSLCPIILHSVWRIHHLVIMSWTRRIVWNVSRLEWNQNHFRTVIFTTKRIEK